MRRRILAYLALTVALVSAWPYGIDLIPVWLALTSYIAYVLTVVALSRPKGWQLTHWVRNGATLVSVSLVLIWLVSIVAYVRVPYAPKRAVAIGSGSFIHHRGVSIAGTPLTLTANWLPTTSLLGRWGTSGADWGKGKAAFSSFIPIWPSAIALAIPTAVLWLLVPKRYPEGHCQNCGYNLTGLVSGRCPECGRPFLSPPRPNSASPP